MSAPTISVVIDNFDNARLLPAAIDSALTQTEPADEVVVVDDGSGDRSSDVIARYGADIVGIVKTNGGQASALNAGFEASSGDVVVFLDSDDVLDRTAVAAARAAFAAVPALGRLQWPMRVIDADGEPTGEVVCTDLESGDLVDRVLTDGPFSYRWSSTSGNAWSRTALAAVLPIPEGPFDLCPDIYLSATTPLYGRIAVTEPRSCWRRHAGNGSRPMQPFDARLAVGLRRFEACLSALRPRAAALRLPLDEERWRAGSWFHRLDRAATTLRESTPPDATIVLVDEDAWEVGGTLAGRTVLPFLEHRGRYVGAPADDEHAIGELSRLRTAGATHVAVAWTATWWLEHYARFADHLGTPDVTTADVIVFDLA
ncbi:glycosyltransferase family 2 protein [Nitriliruptor alkaliphilus]|uniref:glycosyltransferase family 2 protein n=1 Tax=Nitriliruptor alkaliphilus TaxID=427918 RepID=UPI000698A16E|nr:glycosyltransferase [Nitriliruptor alkaliphilus]